MTHPTHGFTKHGHAVHGKTVDHLPTANAYQRFNKKIALALVRYVGSMTCFWVFLLLAFCSLPAVLSGFAVFAGLFPAIIIKASIIALVSWIAQTCFQLILLPGLMVGQNLQNEASDARAAKQFEDTEFIMDQVNENTDGGIATIIKRLDLIKAKLPTKPRRTS